MGTDYDLASVGKEQDIMKVRLESVQDIPHTVSKLTGIVSVIAGLFALLVGLAFNSHFEQLHSNKSMLSRFDTLGKQIETIGKEHLRSKARISERLVRIETRIETAHKEYTGRALTPYHPSQYEKAFGDTPSSTHASPSTQSSDGGQF